MKLDLHLRAQRFRAYILGDLAAATALFERDALRAGSAGKSPADAVKWARDHAAISGRASSIGTAAFLMFCAIDARWIAPRWPTASLAWFAIWLAAALLFAWHFYTVTGPAGWQRAWYRLTGDPRIDDFDAAKSIKPLGRQLVLWKRIVRLSGVAGAILLLAGMMLVRFAPDGWGDPLYWVSLAVAAAAVFWPSIHLDAINQAYHQMMAAALFAPRGE